MLVWLNGELLPQESAQVSVTDHGFTVGDGVFETLHLLNGQPFALSRHLDRLLRSATSMGLPQPDMTQVRKAVKEVVVGNGLVDGRLRITYTSGQGPAGTVRGSGPATLLVSGQNSLPWPATSSVGVAPWRLNAHSPIAGVKSTSYAEFAVALAWARDLGFAEAILANTDDELCEGTSSNVFVVIDGQCWTPPLSSGCLAGVTRELLLEWLPIKERTIPMSELDQATEVFLSSSTRGVQPVDMLGEKRLPAGELAPYFAEEYQRRCLADIDP